MLGLCLNTYSQDQKSFGPAPKASFYTVNKAPHSEVFVDNPNPNNRAFLIQTSGSAFQNFKQGLSSCSPVSFGSTFTMGFPAGYGVAGGHLYAIDQLSPFTLYQVDTSTGAMTNLGTCTGVTLTNMTGLAYDPSSSTMYAVQSNLSQSQIMTLNLTTRVFTPIGSPSSVCAGAIALGCPSSGVTMYAVDLVADNLYSVNKTTGVFTLVGPLGINANFGQDAAFDLSDNTFYWASYNSTSGLPELRIINTTTGTSTLVCSWTPQTEGIAIGPFTGGLPPQAHDIMTGPFLSLPLQPLINVQIAVKTKVTNVGTNTETNIPVKFFINGTLTATPTVASLAPNASDSVSYNWTPTTAGTYNLMYVSSLSTDTNRTNDTVRTAITVYASIPPICEGFNDPNFPPAFWTTGGSGVSYLSRGGPSGYNLGTGSIKFNAWSAPTGSEGDVISPNFPSPTGTNDTLFFDYAYCPYFTNNEQLIVSTSTNAGTTWTTLITMNATDLTTTTACANSEFTPSLASDWASKRLIMPPTTNKVKFAFISAFGNDIWADSICDKGPVGVHRIPTGNVPTVYALSQNYPNPFNPTTKIKFDISGTPLPPFRNGGSVTLKVYDLLGREIETLVNEKLNPGTYEVDFDGSNLPSGVYFYKLSATGGSGDFTAVKKMVLLK